MKINFTKKEYRTLINMLAIADWILHSHRVPDSNDEDDHDLLTRRLYGYFKQFHCEELFEPIPFKDKFYLKDDFFDHLKESYIDNYDNKNFYEELINRLSQRDAIKEIGLEKYKSLDYKDRIEILCKYEKIYIEEFNENDIKNLLIK